MGHYNAKKIQKMMPTGSGYFGSTPSVVNHNYGEVKNIQTYNDYSDHSVHNHYAGETQKEMANTPTETPAAKIGPAITPVTVKTIVVKETVVKSIPVDNTPITPAPITPEVIPAITTTPVEVIEVPVTTETVNSDSDGYRFIFGTITGAIAAMIVMSLIRKKNDTVIPVTPTTPPVTPIAVAPTVDTNVTGE